MMSSTRLILVSAAALAIAGCASKPPRRALAPATQPAVAATTRPAESAATRPAAPEGTALLSLDEISPPPLLGQPRPATQPAGYRPPIDAVALYAEARDKLLGNQRFIAIDLLERAVKLDPDSFELRYALAEALAGTATSGDRAIDAFLQAASLNPDHLPLQTALARLYLARGRTDDGIRHLRLAMQTSEYRRGDDAGAVVEFLLARAVGQKGYDRAALDLYDRLLERMKYRTLDVREFPELAFLIRQPEALLVQIGELYERHHAYDEALEAYALAAERRPDSFDYQSRVVKALAAAGRREDAAKRAADVVRQFRASPEALALLREIHRTNGGGGDAAVIQQLTRLHREHPTDRDVLFALVDVLAAQGRHAEAEQLLARAVRQTNYDVDHVRRMFAIQAGRDDVPGAARLLIDALAARPDSARELTPLMSDLLRPSRRSRLRLPALQKLDLGPSASSAVRASKLYWVSRVAQTWNRDILARTSLTDAAELSPPFAPAHRELLGQHWLRQDWDEARKIAESQALIDAARSAGDQALATELRGLLLLNQKQFAAAADAFARAQVLGNESPDLQLAQAAAHRAAGNGVKAEQVLWKLVSDHPTCQDGYEALFAYYLQAGSANQAVRALRTWLSADPANENARILEASVYLQAGQPEAAKDILLPLFDRSADNPAVLAAMHELYVRTDKLEEFIAKLEAERTRRPNNRAAVEYLLEVYRSQKRWAEAIRVLDGARAAVAGDPDLLYYVAHLYTRIGQEQTTEKVLAEVVKLDPTHAPASNDLGYNWADKGQNLDRAEELIRVAVNAEPDNQSFLDSLGWVLYKRGKFDEALHHLQAAIAPATFPDPVVLDHLGDALYRLGREDEAVAQWKRSQERLGQEGSTEREDLKRLRLQLQQKLKQVEAGQPVNVAPVVEGPASGNGTRQQAKN